MWKIAFTLTTLFCIGAVPTFFPGLLVVHVPAAVAHAGNVAATEYFPDIWGIKLKITDSLVALFTFLLASATAMLWYSTNKLWDASNRQLKLAQDEFNYVHRPRLTIRRERLKVNPKDMGVNFILVNEGDVTASHITGCFDIWVGTGDQAIEITNESAPPYTFAEIDVSALIDRAPRNRGTLLGHERAYIYVPSPRLTREIVESKFDINTILFFGYLSFQGPDGTAWQSTFFRTFNRPKGLFEASEDPDYEYF
jgi:hypothetical protein